MMIASTNAATVSIETPVNIHKNSDQIALGQYSAYWIDEKRDSVLALALKMREQGQWQPSTGSAPNFGISTSVYWYSVALENTSSLPLTKLIEITSVIPDSLSIYSQINQEPVVTVATDVGLKSNYHNRPINHPHVLHKIKIPAKSTLHLYYRHQPSAMSAWLINLHEEEHYWVRDRQQSQIFGGIYALYLLISAIALLFYMANREQNFLYFSIYNLTVFFSQFFLHGDAFSWWPHAGELLRYSYYTSGCI